MLTILVIISILITIIIIDYVIQKIRAPATCGIASAFLLPDKCTGTCPPGASCGATGVRPYGPGGILGVQDATCGCVPIIPPPVPPPSGG
jgi:hypothetical protein